LSSSALTLFFDWVSSCMARNHRLSGSLLASKMVPLIRLVWCGHAPHCQYGSPPRVKWLRAVPPHFGQTKPRGQRAACSAV
jgi:hypothetical protein